MKNSPIYAQETRADPRDRTQQKLVRSGEPAPRLFEPDDERRSISPSDVLDHERLRVAQELHDSTGQLLVALSLSVARLEHQARDGTLSPVIADIRNVVRLIDTEVRNLAFLEYPLELNTQGLGSTLKQFTRGLARRSGLHIDCQCRLRETEIDGDTALCLLRIAQEALVNIHRHARATKARLTLTSCARVLKLEVTDDGCGVNLGANDGERRGIGLDGMRMRAEQLGGDLKITRLKQGTRVTASVPIPLDHRARTSMVRLAAISSDREA